MAGGEATLTDIRDSLALDQITAERLKDRGIETIDQLAQISVDELVDAIDVSFDQANEILERAHRLLAQKHARETREAREAEEASAKSQSESNETAESAAAIAEADVSTPEGVQAPEFPESFEAKEIGAESVEETSVSEDMQTPSEPEPPAETENPDEASVAVSVAGITEEAASSPASAEVAESAVESEAEASTSASDEAADAGAETEHASQPPESSTADNDQHKKE